MLSLRVLYPRQIMVGQHSWFPLLSLLIVQLKSNLTLFLVWITRTNHKLNAVCLQSELFDTHS